MTVELDVILMLAGIAMLAGFFDAIAGGGGLITLPALLLVGIDPIAALATNKLQATSGAVSATYTFAKKGLVEWRAGFPIALMALFGGGLGAFFASVLPKQVLEAVVPILLIAVAIYFAIGPKLMNEGRDARITSFLFALFIAPVIGFYDGILGPGTGSFFLIAFVFLLGHGVLRATSYSKLANASSNMGALILFAISGAIIFPIALSMAVGAIIGAQWGARCAVKFGARIIRPLITTICIIMALKLSLHPDNPLRQLLTNFLDIFKLYPL
jgi:uncharacterized membrane protein YfcA